ncbi:MAG: deoxyhypusine synthase, partial [Candidatus Norongarragalinales archaeon]
MTLNKVKDFTVSAKENAASLTTKFSRCGFQASELGEAVRLMREMNRDKNCVRFFAFTANLAASGLRGVLAQYIREARVDAVITTGGAIDHDLIKCFAPYALGSFFLDDAALHRKKINRLGNILVPNERYVLLEKKVQPVFQKLYAQRKAWSASDFVRELSSELCLRDENSFLRACLERGAPVFVPGLTDSALGLQLHFFKQEKPDFILDETADLRKLATLVLSAKRTGAVVLGGGISKHHVIGANILRGGLDYAVYFTTASPFDGSLSGAQTQEAKSWGKLKEKARHVTVVGDASINFALAAAA